MERILYGRIGNFMEICMITFGPPLEEIMFALTREVPVLHFNNTGTYEQHTETEYKTEIYIYLLVSSI